MNVLYESDELVVLHHVGDPTHGSIVHFSAGFFAKGRFPPWADSIFSKWQGDTILFCPRNKGYFAPSLIEPLLAQLPVLRRPIVVMGSSMGGYGALKYSGHLGADAVLAFSPQFSVSPHEAPFDRRRHAFYDAGLHGDMAIRATDVSGKISIIYDPDIALDKLHAEAVHNVVDTANLVSARYSGHDLFRIFSNRASLTGAVTHTLEKSNEAQWRYIREVKKKSLNYYINLAAALTRQRKASTALKIIEAAFLKFGKNRLLYFSKARALRSQGQKEAAYDAFSTGFGKHAYKPDHGDITFGAKLASNLGLKENALNLFQLSVEVSPFHPSHHIEYIDELFKQGQMRDAIPVITAALDRFPNNQDLLKRMARARAALGHQKPGSDREKREEKAQTLSKWFSWLR